MKENSREEDIKDIEKYISFTSKRENFSHDTDWNWNKDLANKMEHILSDYKRVLEMNEVLLKENEILRKYIESWKKYCEEIEEEQTEMSNKNCELEFEVEKLQKENEILSHENRKLRTIRYDTAYGVENIYLITKRDLVEINTNKYFIEIQDGKFVDLKQVYQENEELKADNYELNNRINDLLDNISVQKVKDKIEEEIKYHEKNILDIENITMLKGKTAKEEAEIEFNKYVIVVLKKILQELIEERKVK